MLIMFQYTLKDKSGLRIYLQLPKMLKQSLMR